MLDGDAHEGARAVEVVARALARCTLHLAAAAACGGMPMAVGAGSGSTRPGGLVPVVVLRIKVDGMGVSNGTEFNRREEEAGLTEEKSRLAWIFPWKPWVEGGDWGRGGGRGAGKEGGGRDLLRRAADLSVEVLHPHGGGERGGRRSSPAWVASMDDR